MDFFLIYVQYFHGSQKNTRENIKQEKNQKPNKTPKSWFFKVYYSFSHPQNFLVITEHLGFPSSPQNEQSPTRSPRSTPGAQFPFPALARPAGYGISVYSAVLSRKKHELSSKIDQLNFFFFKKAAPLTLKNLLLLPNLCFS